MIANPALARIYVANVRRELERRCGLRTAEIADAVLERAVERARADAGIATPEEFAAAIRPEADPDARILQHLVRRVTIGETSFLRHREDVAWLEAVVLPSLIARRTADGTRRLRLWSAGCSTGEEAYSLALLALEAVPEPGAWQIQVLGTDINDEALSVARTAEYSAWSFRGVDPGVRARWFEPSGVERWHPVKALRERVDFRYLNLRDPIYPAILTQTTELDLVLCRNVFLYFQPEAIQDALVRFWACFDGSGWMLCGPSDLFPARPPAGLFASDGGTPHRMRRVPEVPVTVPHAESTGTRPGLAPGKRAVPMPASPLPLPGPAASPPDHGATGRLLDLLRRGQYAEAQLRAREHLDDHPLSKEAARCAALAASALRSEEAIESWKRVLYLDPADPGGHFGLALEYRGAGRDDDARRHFAKVVSLLDGRPDDERLPGPDAIPVGWVRAACESITRKRGAGP